MWSLVMYSNYLEWDLLKEQTIINLSAMLLLKICLYLILFIAVSLHYKKGLYTWYNVNSAWFLFQLVLFQL